MYLTKNYRESDYWYNKDAIMTLFHIEYDETGPYLKCGDKTTSKEAQEHYDKAGQALIEALGHSAAAGLSIEVPPYAAYEVYCAMQAWKEAAKEYNEGYKAEHGDKYGIEANGRNERDRSYDCDPYHN